MPNFHSEYPAIRKIQSGSWSPTGTSATLTLPTALLDTERAFVLYSFSSGGTSNGTSNHLVRIISTTQLQFESAASASGVTINWYVLEFKQGVRVQHLYGTNTVSSGTTNQSINPTDLRKSFVHTSWTADTSSNSVEAKLTSSTQLTYSYVGDVDTYAFQIVEWNGASVQQVEDTVTGASKDTLIDTVNLNRAFIIASHKRPSSGGNNDFGTYYTTNESTVRWSRESSSTGNIEVTYYVISAPQLQVYNGYLYQSSGTSTSNITIPEVWYNSGDNSRAIALTNHHGQPWGYGTQTSYQANYAACRASLSSSTNLQLIRSNSTGDVQYNWFVIEYKEELRIKEKVEGTLSITGSDTVQSVSLSRSFDTTKSIIFFTVNTSESSPKEYNVKVEWGSITADLSNSIEFSRAYSTSVAGDVSIHYYVIEYESGIYVQYGSVATLGSDPYDFTISEVNLNKAFPLITIANDGGVFSSNDQPYAELTSSTNYRLKGQGLNSTGSYFVVEIDLARVQKFSYSGTTPSGSSPHTIAAPVDVDKTFLLSGFQSDADVEYNNLLVQYINSSDEIVIDTSSQDGNYVIVDYLVELQSKSFVQQAGSTWAASTTDSVTILESDTQLSVAWMLGYKNNATYDLSNTDDPSDSLAIVELGSSTSASLTRSGTTSGIPIRIQAVEFDRDSIIYRRKKCAITISSSEVPSSQTDFPVLLSWDGTSGNLPQDMFDADGENAAQYDGGDLYITSDSSGDTRLPIEVVRFNTDNDPSNGYGDVWVLVPSLSSSSDTTIYLWWQTINWSYQPNLHHPYGRGAVWADYLFVMHMDEDRPIAAGLVMDSTINEASVVAVNASNGAITYNTAAKVGKGVDFVEPSSGDFYIDFGQQPQWDLDSSTGFQCYAWARSDVSDNDTTIIHIGAQNAGLEDDSSQFTFQRKSSPTGVRSASTDNGTDSVTVVSNIDTFPQDSFVFVEGGYDGTNVFASTSEDFFRFNNSRSVSGWEQDYYLIIGNSKRSGSFEWDGILDDIFLLGEDKGNDWAKTSYNNTNSPSTFATAGSIVSTHGSIPVTRGLVAQYDPNFLSSVDKDGSNDIRRVKDIASGLFDAHQEESTNKKPSYVDSILKDSSMPVFRFDGTEYLRLPSYFIQGFSPRTIAFVLKGAPVSTTERVVFIGSGSGKGFGVNLSSSNGIEISNSTSSDQTTDTKIDYTKDSIFIISFKGSTFGSQISDTTVYYRNKRSYTSETLDSTSTIDVVDEGDTNYIGTSVSGGSSDLSRDLGEVLIYEGVLTNEETNQLFDYLQVKWIGKIPTRTQAIWVPAP